MAKKRTIRTIPQQRTPVREQAPAERVKNFSEVSCGYTQEDALVEADRCLLCPDQPCVRGCPVGIDIPGFIEKIGQKDFRGAYHVIAATNLLPAVCGRVCPQESQCEGVCTVGKTLEPVAIGRLERFVGDRAIAEGWTNLPYTNRHISRTLPPAPTRNWSRRPKAARYRSSIRANRATRTSRTCPS
jgi:glutamate synthase (NADPH/NADH) small chain